MYFQNVYIDANYVIRFAARNGRHFAFNVRRDDSASPLRSTTPTTTSATLSNCSRSVVTRRSCRHDAQRFVQYKMPTAKNGRVFSSFGVGVNPGELPRGKVMAIGAIVRWKRDSYMNSSRSVVGFALRWAVRGELWPQRGEGSAYNSCA